MPFPIGKSNARSLFHSCVLYLSVFGRNGSVRDRYIDIGFILKREYNVFQIGIWCGVVGLGFGRNCKHLRSATPCSASKMKTCHANSEVEIPGRCKQQSQFLAEFPSLDLEDSGQFAECKDVPLLFCHHKLAHDEQVIVVWCSVGATRDLEPCLFIWK